MFVEDNADLFHGAVHGGTAAEDHGAGGRPPATPRPYRQPRRLRDGRGGEKPEYFLTTATNVHNSSRNVN